MTIKTPVRRTGFTKDTPKKYVIDAAVVYKDLEYDPVATEFKGILLGATNGGVNFSIENTYRDIEVDGARHVKMKGHKILESAMATVVAKLKEMTVSNMQLAINGSSREATEDEAPSGYHVVESKRDLEDGDYIGNIAFVGRVSGTSKPIIAIIDNAIATSNLSVETEDGGEAVVEVTFEAHATFEQLDTDEFPWRILYPEVV